MFVKIWGARGSLPSPLTPEGVEERIRSVMRGFFDQGYKQKKQIEEYLDGLAFEEFGGYGGNTPCVEIFDDTGKDRIIIDGGSGLRLHGYELMKGDCAHGKGEVHLLFTHFHWDHLIGLPFFTPIFIPGNKIHIYAVQPELKDVFKTIFRKPYFPVPLEDLGAEIIYHQLEPRVPKMFGSLKVTPYQLDHPDPCWGYKIQQGDRTLSYCVDTECTRVSREELGEDLPLYQNVDLMIFDAQYTLMEAIEKIHWGHAAASLGLDLAMREGVKRVLFVHHDPASSDDKVAAAELEARRYYEMQMEAVQRKKSSQFELHPVEWYFAREGICVEV